MNTHEYQAKQILKEYGIPVPSFRVISSRSEIANAIEELGITEGIIKAQVHAGGRGKAGAVKYAKTEEEIFQYASAILGMRVVNEQTGKAGLIAHHVMISSFVEVVKEYYMAAIIDRQKASGVLIASPEGGQDIEEVAAKSPDKIFKIPIQLNGCIRRYHLVELAKFMGWKLDIAKQGMEIAQNLAKAFSATDASLFELNPLVLTKKGELLAVDAKFSVDDNALFRQREIAQFYDSGQLPANEAEAHENGLAFVALDGEIGCMVNGAGLAMATMDLIKQHGGMPANFLDVGGGASKEKVTTGFKILLLDKNVKAILVNIFGGIMNCATIAEGIIAAIKELGISVPLVVRMEGTNVEGGKAILSASDLKIVVAENLTEAAKKVVASLKTKSV